MRKNNCKSIVAFFALYMLFAFAELQAQTRIISEEPDTSGEITKFGPNRFYYQHSLLALGNYYYQKQPGMHTDGAVNFTTGGRLKLKIFSWESITYDFAYRLDNFTINQKQTKRAPLNTGVHQRERVTVHNMTMAFCNRFSFGRRGNIMGFWIDMGVYGDWAFSKSNVYLDRYYDSNSSTAERYKVKTRLTRLKYIEPFNYGFTFRMGGDYGGVFANYRVNDLIKNASTTSYNDLPKLNIGLEIYLQEE
jgi:hypothetical protein